MDQCKICGKYGTEVHHVFGASNRKLSDKHGLTVNLCYICHRSQPKGVHGGNRELDLMLKREYQLKFEETHTREEFIKTFGRNYL